MFISWNNQSLHCSRIMCWLQPLIFRHFTALRPEKKKYEVSVRMFGLTEIRFHNYIPRGSEILKNFLYCIFVQGIRNSESSPVLFGGSEILNPLLCCLGDQKFWILSCIVWGIRNSESSPVLFGGIRNSKSPVLFRGQKFRILCHVNRETFPVSFNASLRLRVNCKNCLWN